MTKAKRKTARMSAGAARTAAAVSPSIFASKPGKNNILMVVLGVFILFTAAEILLVVQKTVRQGKKPEFVTSFPNEFKKGLTSLGEYGNHLYAVDSTTNGFVYKVSKKDGRLVKLYQIPEMVCSAVEDKNGDVYILDKQNTVQVFSSKDEPKKKIPLDGIKGACWLELDMKGNFYVIDCGSSMITKYDQDFNKKASFGGQGEGKAAFKSLGKLFAAPNGDLYCVNMLKLNEAQIKILDANGKFKKAWPVKAMSKFSDLANLAITPDGYVYINAFENSLIYVYDSNGKFMGSFDTDAQKRFLITFPPSIAGGKEGLLYIPTHSLGVFKPIHY
ncbi:MAG TPA: NHL repeat-containing protein [Candidatus Goldiibacteriota bacterium]|nr:NHL repeat-containing protein [Candidatus Goldiibacteriota bacterium]